MKKLLFVLFSIAAAVSASAKDKKPNLPLPVKDKLCVFGAIVDSPRDFQFLTDSVGDYLVNGLLKKKNSNWEFDGSKTMDQIAKASLNKRLDLFVWASVHIVAMSDTEAKCVVKLESHRVTGVDLNSKWNLPVLSEIEAQAYGSMYVPGISEDRISKLKPQELHDTCEAAVAIALKQFPGCSVL